MQSLRASGAAIAALAATTLILSGCASPAPAADGAGPGISGTGPISIALGTTDAKAYAPLVESWNEDHPNEEVTIVDLGAAADQQRQLMIQNAQTESSEYTILSVDVIWTAEFAANQWIKELDPSLYPIDQIVKPGVTAATYRDKLYAVPVNIEGGVLYYRTDLLQAAGITAPPTSWKEMEEACALIQATPEGAGVDCYAGQFDKYEGLTVNFSEAVASAGGEIVGPDGKPNVDTPEALTGLTTLVDAFKGGTIAPEALTYMEETGRQAFQDGNLIFHRQWAYQYGLANATDGSSQVAGKFDIAPIPGVDGEPGATTLGGHLLAISAFGKNTKTASDVIAYISSEDSQRALLESSSIAPAIGAIYDDPALIEKYGYLPVLKQANETASPRPIVVNYGDVTAAIQEEAYSALSGAKTPEQALKDLQAALIGIIE